MSYSIPVTVNYRFPAASVVSAATLGRLIGPKGMQGRLVDIGTVVTTGVTVANSNVIVGTAGDTDAFGTLPVIVSAANAVANGMTRGVDPVIPADTLVAVGSAGGATAGAADILVTIAWY
jgi:hypothetical protein